MGKQMKVIGKRQTRIDGWERVSGKATYPSDIYLPGMLYGKILRSPYPHAKIANIDVERAKALSGVKVVLTPKDMAAFSWSQSSRHP